MCSAKCRSRSLLICLTSVLVLAACTRTTVADAIPIPITGFNQDIVVEAAAVNDPTTHYLNYVTATMDAGTAKTGNTWYERGLNLASPTTGLPMGVLLAAQDDPSLLFQLQPATAANAVVVDAANPNANIDFLVPLRLRKLHIITASSNGSLVGGRLGLQFTDLAPGIDTTFTSADWFNGTPIAVTASGRLVPSTGEFNNVAAANPRLYFHTIDLAALGADSRELFRLNIGFTGSPTGNTHTAIMAVAGEVVPEPGALSLLAFTGLALCSRRRHAPMASSARPAVSSADSDDGAVDHLDTLATPLFRR